MLNKYNIYFFLVLLLSSSCIHKTPEQRPHKDSYELIIQYLNKGLSNNEVLEFLGGPNQMVSFDNKSKPAHIYNNSETNFQEWTFIYDSSKNVTSMDYMPPKGSSLYWVQDLLEKFKNGDCKKMSKSANTDHVVKKIYFISCFRGRLKAFYNQYNEVRSIYVK